MSQSTWVIIIVRQIKAVSPVVWYLRQGEVAELSMAPLSPVAGSESQFDLSRVSDEVDDSLGGGGAGAE